MDKTAAHPAPHGSCSRCSASLSRVEARDSSHVCLPPTPHTPGPWLVEPCQWDHGASLVIVAKGSHVLAKIEPINDGDEDVDADNAQREPDDEANAALMAAAPDLLAASKAALSWFLRAGYKVDGAVESLNNAIAKAEGR